MVSHTPKSINNKLKTMEDISMCGEPAMALKYPILAAVHACFACFDVTQVIYTSEQVGTYIFLVGRTRVYNYGNFSVFI